MKVLLIKPHNLTDHIQPSLGLGYLASAIRDKAEVKILDCIKEKITLKRLGPAIKRHQPWDLIRPQDYPESQQGAVFKKFPIAPITITRGRPFQCTFCAGKLVSGSRLRKRSIKSVIAEINMLYRDFGIREFHIVDDNSTLDTVYSKSFFRELIA
jgi:radical SAM superfamily enzyme YgiQ (UPF0313 family)